MTASHFYAGPFVYEPALHALAGFDTGSALTNDKITSTIGLGEKGASLVVVQADTALSEARVVGAIIGTAERAATEGGMYLLVHQAGEQKELQGQGLFAYLLAHMHAATETARGKKIETIKIAATAGDEQAQLAAMGFKPAGGTSAGSTTVMELKVTDDVRKAWELTRARLPALRPLAPVGAAGAQAAVAPTA